MRGIPVSFPEPVAVSAVDSLNNARLTTRHIFKTVSGAGFELIVPSGMTWYVEQMLVTVGCSATVADRYPYVYVDRDGRSLSRTHLAVLTAGDMLFTNMGNYDAFGDAINYNGIGWYAQNRPFWRGPYLSGDKIGVNAGSVQVDDTLSADLVVTEVSR